MTANATLHLPTNFRRIRLERARDPGHADGDAGIGYTMIAPLKRDGLLDTDSARVFRAQCKVVRFRRGEDSVEGYLRRRPGAGGPSITSSRTAPKMMILASGWSVIASVLATMSRSWRMRARTPIA